MTFKLIDHRGKPKLMRDGVTPFEYSSVDLANRALLILEKAKQDMSHFHVEGPRPVQVRADAVVKLAAAGAMSIAKANELANRAVRQFGLTDQAARS